LSMFGRPWQADKIHSGAFALANKARCLLGGRIHNDHPSTALFWRPKEVIQLGIRSGCNTPSKPIGVVFIRGSRKASGKRQRLYPVSSRLPRARCPPNEWLATHRPIGSGEGQAQFDERRRQRGQTAHNFERCIKVPGSPASHRRNKAFCLGISGSREIASDTS